MGTTKRRSRNEHHKRFAEIRNRTQQAFQTFVSFYLLNKMSRNVGIVWLVQFSKYLESFSMIRSGIRYIVLGRTNPTCRLVQKKNQVSHSTCLRKNQLHK